MDPYSWDSWYSEPSQAWYTEDWQDYILIAKCEYSDTAPKTFDIDVTTLETRLGISYEVTFNRKDPRSHALSGLYNKNIVDIRNSPNYAIFDTGCTRSMASLRGIQAFLSLASSYGVWAEWKRANTKMSFANSSTAILRWCVVVHFPTTPPISTTIDIHEEGDIPILFSPSSEELRFQYRL